uniref:Ribonuclease H-like domain-containing protein n=1 Tax=Tanacetum cinerariifolium TaxID=118510 RepID=A0A699H6N8_TANCI|nr:ribonuclease H-like domain-containing protein [Tanacetum cinerariifolium]
MHKDVAEIIHKCDARQIQSPISRLSKQDMTSVTSTWSFIQSGIDIMGPLREVLRKVGFLNVVLDYFTKRVEAKLLANITGKHVERFISEHIVCRTSNRQVKPHAKLRDSIYNINGGKNHKLKDNPKGIQNDKNVKDDCNDVDKWGMESVNNVASEDKTDRDDGMESDRVDVVEESIGDMGIDKVNSNNNNCDCNKVAKSGINGCSTKENVEINSFATAVRNNNAVMNNKLDFIPPDLNDKGDDIAIFEEELVQEGCRKWDMNICGYFVGSQMLLAEVKYNVRRIWGKHGLSRVFMNGNDGTPSRYKARLMVNGSTQFEGVDVDETFSSVVKPGTIRTKKYTIEILEKAHMVDCNSSWTPVDTESKIGADGDPISDPTLYRSLASSLQYLTFTHLDISYAVQQVCLYMHDPWKPHFSALKRVLRYVRGILDYGLQLFSSFTIDFVAYSDVDWVGFPTTRRSTSGYCVFLGNNPLSWSAKRQPTLSHSNAEAEYRGVVIRAKSEVNAVGLETNTARLKKLVLLAKVSTASRS